MVFKLIVRSLLGGFAIAATLNSRDQNSPNWCGRVLKGSDFAEVDASWVVPQSYPTTTNRKYQPYFNYQWVGIDGDTSNCSAILQAGTFAMLRNDQLYYGFWHEFFPNGVQLLTEPTVNAGDVVYVKIQAISKTAGHAFLENRSTGRQITIQMRAPPGSELCQSTAEWIQENSGGDPRTFAPFDTFSFNSCHATDRSGNSYNLGHSEKVDMENLCSSSVGDTSVSISYYGSRAR